MGRSQRKKLNWGALNHWATFPLPTATTATTSKVKMREISMLNVKLALASLSSLPKGIDSSYLRHTSTLVAPAMDINIWRMPKSLGTNRRAIIGALTKLIIHVAILLVDNFITLAANDLLNLSSAPLYLFKSLFLKFQQSISGLCLTLPIANNKPPTHRSNGFNRRFKHL